MRGNQDEKDLSDKLVSEEKSEVDSEITNSSNESSVNSNDSLDEPIFIEDPKIQFTYENMVENLINLEEIVLGSIHGEFLASHLRRETFITFGYKDVLVEQRFGWKAHIAIDDSDKGNLAKAWNLVKDIFIDEKLAVKVVIPDADFYKDQFQCGKQITIYCHMTPDKDWVDIFHKIENTLSAEDIQAYEFSSSDRPIPGSRFLSYRNDDNGKGQYIVSHDNYNAANHEDIFLNIEIQPLGVRFR